MESLAVRVCARHLTSISSFYYRGPLVSPKRNLWGTDEDIKPSQFRLKYPGAVMTKWNREGRRRRPPEYRDVPDYWTWR